MGGASHRPLRGRRCPRRPRAVLDPNHRPDGSAAARAALALSLGATFLASTAAAPTPEPRAQLAAAAWTAADGTLLDLGLEQLLDLLRDAEIVERARFDEGGRPRAFDDSAEGDRGTYLVTLHANGIEIAATFRSQDDRFQVAHFEDGSTAVHFRDFGLFECAAYDLARAAGIDHVLPAVVRRIGTVEGCLQLRLPEAFSESTRASDGREDPSPQRWHKQLATMNVFDALIGNTDRNRQNLLYDETWRIWLTDHTRAFTRDARIDTDALQAVEARFWDRLSALTAENLAATVGDHLTGGELEGLIARHRQLVDHFDRLIAERGRARVVYPY